VVAETLTGIRTVAACGAEAKMIGRYNRLFERASKMSIESSPLVAVQHAPGQYLIDALKFCY
jgi:ATP-binding cassette subfamily B (MDR/TAP) protein 1